MSGHARSAACLLAMLAVASCTSADGLMPPAEIGSGGLAAGDSSTVVSGPTFAAAPSAGASQTAVPSPTAATAPTAPASLAAAAPPAFSGTEPSASAPQQQTAVAPVAVAAAGSAIGFAPITGAAEEAVAPLRQQLAARARQRGIGIAGNGSLPTHILRGYLSEVADANSTTVIYVWDVVDPAGNRLHRIQGTAKVKGKGGWSAVSADTMAAIADRTIDDLVQWLSSRSG